MCRGSSGSTCWGWQLRYLPVNETRIHGHVSVFYVTRTWKGTSEATTIRTLQNGLIVRSAHLCTTGLGTVRADVGEEACFCSWGLRRDVSIRRGGLGVRAKREDSQRCKERDMHLSWSEIKRERDEGWRMRPQSWILFNVNRIYNIRNPALREENSRASLPCLFATEPSP